MAHFAGHTSQDQGQGFAREFQQGQLLQNIQLGIDPANRRMELEIGRVSRTRQLSPAQEAFLISQGKTAQAGSLVNARLRADFQRAAQEQRERLIAEQRQFQVEEEKRIFRRNQALREQQQRQGLLGSIFGNIAGLGGQFIGGALGGPIGAVAGGALTNPLGGGNQNIGGIPPANDPLAAGFR